MKSSVSMALFLILLLTAGPVNCVSPAAARDSLDEIIDGFEEPRQAASAPDTDGLLEGFDEDPAAGAQTEKTEVPSPSVIGLDGYFKLGASFNFAHDAPDPDEADWRDLSRLRSELQLELTVKPDSPWQAFVSGKGFYDAAYAIKGRDQFTDDVLDDYEDEAELREAYVLISPTASLDVKVGRQTVVWGKSDNIRVTDVLNPLDLREPGLTDIEDMRLPVTMTRVDYFKGPWRCTGVAVHEIRFNKAPVFGHDFFPATAPLPPEKKPANGGSNTEFGLAISGVFSGWDIAFYGARIFNDVPHVKRVREDAGLERRHARLCMAGAAANLAMGNFLLKTEAAYFSGLEFYNTPGTDYDRIDVLAGAEYSGFHETTVSLEAVIRHVNDFPDILESSPDNAVKDEFQTALRVEREFLNDTLKLTLLALTYGITGQDGALQRLSAQYDLTDAIQLTGGVALYHSGDLAGFETIGDNDRLYMEVKYHF